MESDEAMRSILTQVLNRCDGAIDRVLNWSEIIEGICNLQKEAEHWRALTSMCAALIPKDPPTMTVTSTRPACNTDDQRFWNIGGEEESCGE